jgi:NADH dehydrogenase FAD-containing subunit
LNNKTPRNNGTTKKRILILGGGFGGAYAAPYLEKRLESDSGSA